MGQRKVKIVNWLLNQNHDSYFIDNRVVVRKNDGPHDTALTIVLTYVGDHVENSMMSNGWLDVVHLCLTLSMP